MTPFERLTESPGPMQRHPHTGADYYTGEQIITHLNYALGPDGWDWQPLDHGLDVEADEVWVLGQLSARFVVHDPNDEGYRTTTAVKIERGWQPVNRKRSGERISLGNDYKAAATDALKRCARLLGVGLDAWAKDEPTRHAADAPRPPKTKAELVADATRGLEAARALGLSVTNDDPSRLDRARLIDLIKDLRARINAANGTQTPTSQAAG